MSDITGSSHNIKRLHAICIAVIAFSHGNATNPVCTTPECRELGNTYLKNMDPSISPCTNFYEHVCRNWAINNPKPEGKQFWDVHQALGAKVTTDLKTILETSQPDIPEISLVQSLYRACINLPYLPRSDPRIIKDVISKMGIWPMFFPSSKDVPVHIPWWTINNNYIGITGESALFDIAVASDVRTHYQIMTEIRPLFSPFGALKRSNDWGQTSTLKNHYKAFLYKIIEKVGPANLKQYTRVIEKDLNDVINFREELRLVSTLQRGPYTADTIGNIQQWYNKETNAQGTAMVNWMRTVLALYKDGKDPQGVPISLNSTLSIPKLFVADLGKLLEKTPNRIIANHIHLYFAERNAELSPDMKAELKKSVSLDDYPNNILRYRIPRWKWCINSHDMRTTLGAVYIAKKFSPMTKAKMNILPNLSEPAGRVLAHSAMDVINNSSQVEFYFVQAKTIMQNQVAQSTWLSNNMKNKTISMIKRIRGSIGYQEHYIEPGQNTQAHRWNIDPLKMQMLHKAGPNEIFVSAAFLQSPIYTRNAPYVVNYGSTVVSLGHELYHALGEKGLQHAYGMNKPLWPIDTYTKYQERTKCFQQQYKKYRDKGLKMYKLQPSIPPPSTVEEDLADVMGLKLAYAGYKETLSNQMGVCKILPGFENIGCEKLFFIAFANTFCSDALPGIEEKLYMHDVHSTPHVRVNGAVANMKEFSDAFGCKPKDSISIQKKCDLWH